MTNNAELLVFRVGVLLPTLAKCRANKFYGGAPNEGNEIVLNGVSSFSLDESVSALPSFNKQRLTCVGSIYVYLCSIFKPLAVANGVYTLFGAQLDETRRKGSSLHRLSCNCIKTQTSVRGSVVVGDPRTTHDENII